MNPGEWVSWGVAGSFVLFALAHGAGPALIARLLVHAYPKSDPRRAELLAETAYIQAQRGAFGVWSWVGQTVVVILWDALPMRLAATGIACRQVWVKWLGYLWDFAFLAAFHYALVIDAARRFIAGELSWHLLFLVGPAYIFIVSAPFRAKHRDRIYAAGGQPVMARVLHIERDIRRSSD